MKLLHAADLHIDSPLRGLSAYEGAPADELRTASRRALENLVELARTEAVDAVLLAGDIYDGNWQDYSTGLFFAAQMAALREADIPVYLVSGNHDAESKITLRLTLPDNVHTFGTGGPETIEDKERGLAVHGQGFARQKTTENLALSYPRPRDGLFNIGLLHTALTGRQGHHSYAPCTPQELQAKGYDYWALGHVHTREVVASDPWIVFPGNIQGRNARETGPKGCTLVTVEGLKVVEVQHRNLDVARWEHVHVEVPDAADLDDVAESVFDRLRTLAGEDGDLLRAVRVSVTGPTPAHLALCRDRDRLVNQLRADANMTGRLWIEKVRIETRPPGGTDDSTAGLIADLSRTADALRLDGDRLRGLITGSPLHRSLPPDVLGRDRIDLDDPEWLERIRVEAVDRLNAMIAQSQENR